MTSQTSPPPSYSSDVRLILSSIAQNDADAFARAMCEARIVACVNIVPGVRSTYWWEGELCTEVEAILMMETTAARLDDALALAARIHPYDTPKLIAIEPDAVAEPFAQWCGAQVRG